MTRMKSETLEEARDRLAQLSEREKAGTASVSEGQVIADPGQVAEEGTPEATLLARSQEARITPAVSDVRGEPRPAARTAKKAPASGDKAPAGGDQAKG